ncbi:acetylornithine transaminase [Bacillus sp. MUM 13]|uniref:acetylornithine transaminase n=1 Tax=Bacillus sp. MUM 13 TaxID=1678001 RepID=UPI0008F5BF65|nr:acetylornithine transaminase [Bacillus sp. MUM 13]OIK11195.1 aspartate aminotransferase family protein [Bacillus sp. MUM 13]
MNSLFPTYQHWDIEPITAKGSWLTAADGKKYLDFTSGIGVTGLGHCSDYVMDAVKEQLNHFWHTSNMFRHSKQESAAALLAEASGLDRVFFANSGAEANEAAIKLARKATGKSKIITCHGSFHGRTFAGMAATGQEKVRTGYGPMLKEFQYISFNNSEEVKKMVDKNTAAVMLEIVQGEGGVHPACQEFLTAITEACRESGALIIIDEIQTGIGRTGKPFAFQHFDISPDIITSAKGLGNGLPIGAMIGKENLADYFGPGSHGSTFGGNPVSISAAEAVLKKIMDPDFQAEIEKKAGLFLKQLQHTLSDAKGVSEIRGLGLMIGIELKEGSENILLQLQKEGLLVLTAGSNVLRLLPPLTAQQEEFDYAVKVIGEALRIKQNT